MLEQLAEPPWSWPTIWWFWLYSGLPELPGSVVPSSQLPTRMCVPSPGEELLL
jgi:hypothetical protein